MALYYFANASVGDIFRWTRSGELCKITGFKDDQVHFHYLDAVGRDTGRWGYTIVPQDVELVDPITLLGWLASS